MQQVAGHLQEKKGYFYAVLSFKDVTNKRKTKWIATGLPVKGNKKKAEAALAEIRRTFKVPTAPTDASSMADMLFADYMILAWHNKAIGNTEYNCRIQYEHKKNNRPIFPRIKCFPWRFATETHSRFLFRTVKGCKTQFGYSIPCKYS